MHPVTAQYVTVCGCGLDMAQPIFWCTSLMHCEQTMMGFTSQPPHLQLKSRRGHRRSPAAALPHSTLQ
jgi:hypothetical protein